MADILQLTELLSDYMVQRYNWYRLGGEPPGPVPSTDMGISLVLDAELLAMKAAEASKTCIELDWDADRLSDRLGARPTGRNEEFEKQVMSEYPSKHPPPGPLQHLPCIIIDAFGKILCWYIPDALPPARQIVLWNATLKISGQLKAGLSSSSAWRMNPALFKPSGSCTPCPGGASISPAWFQQGHDKSHHLLEISESLKGPNRKMWPWLLETRETMALVGALLKIIHPELYTAGVEALRNLNEKPHLVSEEDQILELLQIWSTPFSALSIISNRVTPAHWDSQSRPAWYDILVTLGEYTEGVLRLPGAGLQLRYNPGTLVALCGKVLQHEVPAVDGDRVCIACYMRDKVHHRLHVAAPGWMTVSQLPGINSALS